MPLEKRDASRLMVLRRADGSISHEHFYQLIDHLHPGDCLVMNDSRVIPARLLGHRMPSGGAAEVLLLTDKGGGLWECLVKPGRKLHEGAELSFGEGQLTATVETVLESGNRLVRFHYESIFLEILEQLGKMPLPPYIKAELADGERYQTVYSKVIGSAAAPTAGLHFTTELLQRIAAKGVHLAYVTLHVGLGTFRPVKVDDVLEHHLCRHDLQPHARIALRRGRKVCRALGLDGYFHLSRLPLQGHGRIDYGFPPAGKHAHHACFRLCRLRHDHECLPRRRRGTLPLL